MNNEVLDLAAAAIRTAKGAGADGSSVTISTERNVEVSYRERKPETIKEASSRTLRIELYANGRYSAQSTSDLRPDAVKKFITESVSMTKLLAEDPYRSLTDPKYYAGREDRDLELVDARYAKMKPEDRHDIAKSIEESSLSRGGSGLVSATSRVQDGHVEDVMVTSNGFEGSSESTYYLQVAQVTLQDAGDRRPTGYTYVVSAHRKDLPSPEHVGSEAVDRTRAQLGGRKIKTETLPIIVENRNVPRILGGLLQAMSGRAIQQKQSFLADKKGQRIGSEQLTLVDDPFVPRGLGSQLFDGDGMTTKRRIMIDAGVLQEFYVDWYYSRKLGCEPTTARPSNIVIPAGKRSVQQIMKDLGRGILIADFIGGNSNSTTGDASVGILGRLFEAGEPVQAVAEMNIAGNALEFWPRLIEVADDPWPYSSRRTPSLVFRDVVVSGV